MAVIIAVMFPQTGINSQEKRSEGFQLLAELGKNIVLPNEPIVLNLTLRNATKEAFLIADTVPAKDYKVTVLNEKGVLVQTTKYLKSDG